MEEKYQNTPMTFLCNKKYISQYGRLNLYEATSEHLTLQKKIDI